MVNAYIEDSYKLVFPILCNGYLNIDYDAPIALSGTKVSTGVLVNGAVTNSSTTNIAVDTVDATTKFSKGDNVYDADGNTVGQVSSVTATQITLTSNNAQALSNDENLKQDLTSVSSLRNRSIWSDDAEVGVTNGFVLEAILTPYDVNGIGSRTAGRHGVLDSQKTPPYPNDNSSDVADRTAYESVDYLGSSAYLQQKMMIFHNANLKFYLQNVTSTSSLTGSSYNQPAEYKLVAELTKGGTTEKIESHKIITASKNLYGYYDNTGYYNGITTSHRRVTTSATGSNPSGTITIQDYDDLERNTKSTGQIVISGDIANYTKPVKATGSITIVQRNNLNTDVVGATAEEGTVQFYNQPVNADGTDANNHILVTHESGNPTRKWFALSGITNGADLSGTASAGFTWPSGAKGYLIGTTVEETAQNFADAVNADNTGFAGSASNPRDGTAITFGFNTPEEVTLTVAITGSAPNRKGNDGAVLSAGSTLIASNNYTETDGSTQAGVKIIPFTGGVNELILGETTGSNDNTINYFTLTDSAGNTKNYFPAHDSTQTTGSTGTRTLDDNSTVSVVYFNFASNANNNGAATALANAINHNNGHGSTITAVASGATVNLTHDLTGAAGNNATIAKANIANSAATISGANFTGGVTETNATDTPFIQLVDNAGSPVTKKYVPVANGGAIATGGLNGGSIGDVSGGIAFQEGGSASATADNLRTAIAHSNGHAGSILTDSAGSATINLTQNTIGANTAAITLSDLPSNISKTNFSGGGTPDNFISVTDASGTLKKYKASTHEVTGTTDGTYTFFKAETNNNTTAANLETAIDGANGHNGTLITTRANNVLTVKLNQASMGSAAMSDNITDLATVNFSAGNNTEISVGSGEATEIGPGNKIYDSSIQELGTVASVSGDTITLTSAPAYTVTSTIYTDQRKEALYLEQVFKVSLVYNRNNLELHLNNSLVKQKAHNVAPFYLDKSDCQIGRGSGNSEQFFGELFEIAMHKSKRPSTNSHTLSPGFSDILFYYTFGD